MSLIIEQNRSLREFNTFGVEASSAYFAEAHDDQQIGEALAQVQHLGVPLLILGGGSNLVLTADVNALVLRVASRGIRIIEDDG